MIKKMDDNILHLHICTASCIRHIAHNFIHEIKDKEFRKKIVNIDNIFILTTTTQITIFF